MNRYFIEIGRESVPQVRELSNQEYNLLHSIIEFAQNGIIEEYPFTHEDLIENVNIFANLNTRTKQNRFMYNEIFDKYSHINQEVVRHFASEILQYYLDHEH